MKKTMNGTQEIKIINLLFDKSSTVSDKKHKKTMNKKDAPIASYVLFFSAFCDIMENEFAIRLQKRRLKTLSVKIVTK